VHIIRELLLTTIDSLPALPRLERIGWCRANTPDYHGYLDPYRDHYVGVQISLTGRGALWPRGEKVHKTEPWLPLPPGTAICFDSKRHHLCYGFPPDGRQAWECLYLNLYGEAAIAIADQLVERSGHLLRCAPDHTIVRDLLSRLPREGHASATIAAGECARLAMEVLSALIDGQEDPERRQEGRLVAAAMAFFRAHLGDNIGVAQAARHCGVSRESLTRTFTARCGESPARWLRRQRLLVAEHLLQHDGATVAGIASQCGFASASHFIKMFHAHAGRSPGSYRRHSR
jgi:AraC-like DNA-binding protein